MSTSPPGWYPDPSGRGQLKWWDGSTWTDHVSVSPPGATLVGSATQSARSMSWMLLLLPVAALSVLMRGEAAAISLLVAVVLAGAIILPLQRRAHRRSTAAALASGAMWGASVTSQPPNMGFGQSGRSLIAGWSPSYWRTVARGRLSVYPQLIVFEPRKPSPRRPALRITPDQVASIGAARFSAGGLVEVHFRDGNRRRFTLYGPPGSLNDVLRQAGFPVS